jgi:hypothetical protein
MVMNRSSMKIRTGTLEPIISIIRDGTNIYERSDRTLRYEVSRMTDEHPGGVQSWTETMSARERIRSVALTLSEPRSTNWISDQAETAWSTTNQELDDLVDRGQLRRVDAGESTLYQPDYTRLLFDELRQLIEEHTREQLQAELTAIAEEIEDWQEAYGVETWEELEQSLADGTLSSAEIRERRDVIRDWQANEEDRRLIRHALELYSDVEAARERMLDAADLATS